MGHLRKSAVTGHLLHNANGHLVKNYFASTVWGETPIMLGDWTLENNQSGQQRYLYVTSDGLETSQLNLHVKMNCGTDTPMAFEGVDIISNSIFKDNNNGIIPGSYITPRVALQYLTTVRSIGNGKVPLNGLIAEITLSTTGHTHGQTPWFYRIGSPAAWQGSPFWNFWPLGTHYDDGELVFYNETDIIDPDDYELTMSDVLL